MSDILQEFLVAIGFQVDSASERKATKSLEEYERAVVEAERRAEAARLAGAKTAQEAPRIKAENAVKEARRVLASAKERQKAEADEARHAKQRADEEKKRTKARV